MQAIENARERLKAAVAWYGPARAFATAGSVVVVCIGAWWLLRAPAPPLENSLPFAGVSTTSQIGQGFGTTSPAPFGTSMLSGLDITVHVVGAVMVPGVYTLRAGSRVVDAVDEAGGPTPDADLASVNMALPLADADQVFIPQRVATRVSRSTLPAPVRRTNPTHPTVPQAMAAATTIAPSAGPVAGASNKTVNVNTADQATLESLPGVGPSTAKAIIARRQSKGPFGKIEDLLEVKGIGDAKFADMKPFVSVS